MAFYLDSWGLLVLAGRSKVLFLSTWLLKTLDTAESCHEGTSITDLLAKKVVSSRCFFVKLCRL